MDTNTILSKNLMIINGEATISVNPDTAIIRLGVQSNGLDLATLQANNAEIAQSILDTLRNMGVEDIKTSEYSINKLYEYVDGKQLDRGYQIRNIFEIRTKDLDLVGSIIDASVVNGANVVDFITFEISDQDYYYEQALNLAIANAYNKAQSIANNFNLQVVPTPYRIIEQGMNVTPLPRYSLARDAISTPIEPGNKDVIANVSVEFIIY